MDCKRIQEMILTDYLDGEENEDLRFFIKNHLDRCRDCKEFEKMVHEHAVDPFKAGKQAEVPQAVWQNIRGIFETFGIRVYVFRDRVEIRGFIPTEVMDIPPEGDRIRGEVSIPSAGGEGVYKKTPGYSENSEEIGYLLERFSDCDKREL
jgi:hypothetical protein